VKKALTKGIPQENSQGLKKNKKVKKKEYFFFQIWFNWSVRSLFVNIVLKKKLMISQIVSPLMKNVSTFIFLQKQSSTIMKNDLTRLKPRWNFSKIEKKAKMLKKKYFFSRLFFSVKGLVTFCDTQNWQKLFGQRGNIDELSWSHRHENFPQL